MKKTILILLAFFFSQLLFPQGAPNVTDAQGRKQGRWIKYDDQQKKMYEGNFVDNIPTGKFTYYYDTGIPWAVTIFSDKGKTARTKTYDAGGNITGEGKYADEKRDSIWKFYNPDGKMISDETYVNGKKNGICRVYYATGEIAEEKTWKDGLPNGKWKKYFDSGQLKYEGQFVNDKVDGPVKFYFPSGKVEVEGVYKDDLKNGVWIYYKEDGKIKSKDTYIMGRNTNPNKDVITKEETEKAKKKYENSEMNNPQKEGYIPPK